MAKKSKPERQLSKAINTTLSLPNLIDKFVKQRPHLNEDEAFVKACLGIKNILSQSRLLFTMVFDTVTQYMEEDEDETE